MLLCQYRADQPDQGGPVGEDAHDVGAATDLPIRVFLGVVRAALPQRSGQGWVPDRCCWPGSCCSPPLRIIPGRLKSASESWTGSLKTGTLSACCVEPIVAEVSADTAFENGSFRHRCGSSACGPTWILALSDRRRLYGFQRFVRSRILAAGRIGGAAFVRLWRLALPLLTSPNAAPWSLRWRSSLRSTSVPDLGWTVAVSAAGTSGPPLFSRPPSYPQRRRIFGR